MRNSEILTQHEIKINQFGDEQEYDANELWNAIQDVCLLIFLVISSLIFHFRFKAIKAVVESLRILEIDANEIIAIGICNQRETTLLWNKRNGEVYNTIIHSDTRLIELKDAILARTRNKKNYLRSICGLPLEMCFSAIKIKWLIENYASIQEAIKQKECYFGNLDSWIMWNLTGGIENGIHSTDVTNASRTMLMNLETLQWDKKVCAFFEIPIEILPQIKSSAEIYGYIKIRGSPILEGN